MPKAPAQLGEVFLLVLSDGRFLPVQVLAQRQKSLLSICGILGTPVASEQEAAAARPGWTAHDIVAEVTVPTKNLTNHDGAPWPRLGVFVPLKAPSVDWRERSWWFRLKRVFGVDDTGSFSSIGILYSVAQAFVGLEPWDGMDDPDYYEERLTPAGKARAKRVFSKPQAPSA